MIDLNQFRQVDNIDLYYRFLDQRNSVRSQTIQFKSLS